MDRFGSGPPDGALERFLSSALAAILTIIFSWKILLETPRDDSYRAITYTHVPVAAPGESESMPTGPSHDDTTEEIQQENRTDTSPGSDRTSLTLPIGNTPLEQNGMAEDEEEATLTPSSPLNLVTLADDLESPRDGAISRFGMRGDEEIAGYIQENTENGLDLSDSESPLLQADIGLGDQGLSWTPPRPTDPTDLVQPSSNANIDSCTGVPQVTRPTHTNRPYSVDGSEVDSALIVDSTQSEDELFLLSGVEVNARLPRRIQQRFLEVLAARGQLPPDQDLEFHYDLESGGVSLQDSTVIGSLEQFLLEEGCLDSSESEWEEDWLNRTLDTITEEDSSDLDSSSEDELGTGAGEEDRQKEGRTQVPTVYTTHTQRPLGVCLPQIDRRMDETESNLSTCVHSDSGSVSSDLDDSIQMTSPSLYTPVSPQRHIVIGPYVDRTSDFSRNRHVYLQRMQQNQASAASSPDSIAIDEDIKSGGWDAGLYSVNSEGDMVADCDNIGDIAFSEAGDTIDRAIHGNVALYATAGDTNNLSHNTYGTETVHTGDNIQPGLHRDSCPGDPRAQGQIIKPGEVDIPPGGPQTAKQSIIKSVNIEQQCMSQDVIKQVTGEGAQNTASCTNDMQGPSDARDNGLATAAPKCGVQPEPYTVALTSQQQKGSSCSCAKAHCTTCTTSLQVSQLNNHQGNSTSDIIEAEEFVDSSLLSQVCATVGLGYYYDVDGSKDDNNVISDEDVSRGLDLAVDGELTNNVNVDYQDVEGISGDFSTSPESKCEDDGVVNDTWINPLEADISTGEQQQQQVLQENIVLKGDYLTTEGPNKAVYGSTEELEDSINFGRESPAGCLNEIGFKKGGFNFADTGVTALQANEGQFDTPDGSTECATLELDGDVLVPGKTQGVACHNQSHAQSDYKNPQQEPEQKQLINKNTEPISSGEEVDFSPVNWDNMALSGGISPLRAGGTNATLGDGVTKAKEDNDGGHGDELCEVRSWTYSEKYIFKIPSPDSANATTDDHTTRNRVIRPSRPAPPRPHTSPAKGSSAGVTRPSQAPARPKSPPKGSPPRRPQAPVSPKRSPQRPANLPERSFPEVKVSPKSSPSSIQTYEIHHRKAVIPHQKTGQGLTKVASNETLISPDPQDNAPPKLVVTPPKTSNYWDKSNSANNIEQSSLSNSAPANNQHSYTYSSSEDFVDGTNTRKGTGLSGIDKYSPAYGQSDATREISKVSTPQNEARIGRRDTNTSDGKAVGKFKENGRVVKATATSTALARREPLYGDSVTEPSESVVSAVASAEAESENPYIAVARASARAATVATASAAQTVATSHAKYPNYEGGPDKDIAVVISTSCVINGSDDSTVVQDTKGVLQSVGKGVNVSVQTHPRAPITDASTQSSPDQKRKLRITIEQPNNYREKKAVRTMECELPDQAAQNEIQSLINMAVKKMLEDESNQHHQSSLPWDQTMEESIINRVTEQVVSAYSERTRPYMHEKYNLAGTSVPDDHNMAEDIPPWRSHRAPLSVSERKEFTQEANKQYFYVSDPDKNMTEEPDVEPVLQVVDKHSFSVSTEKPTSQKTPPPRPRSSPAHGAKEPRGRQSRPRERAVKKAELNITPSYNTRIGQKPLVVDTLQLGPHIKHLTSSTDTINSTESESKGKEKRKKKKRKGRKTSDDLEEDGNEKKLKGILKKPKDHSPDRVHINKSIPSTTQPIGDINSTQSIPVMSEAQQPGARQTLPQHRTGISTGKPSTERTPKEYHSVLQEPVKDERTPGHILKQFTIEKEPLESRIKLNNSRQQFYERQSVSPAGRDSTDSRPRPKSSPPKIKPFLVDINLEDTYQVSKSKIDPEELRKKLASARPVAPSSSYVEKVWNAGELIAARSQEIGLDTSEEGRRSRRSSPSPSEGYDASSKDGLFRRTQSLSAVDPNRFFNDRTSYTSLIETDLDTGNVKETPLIAETDLDGTVPSKARSLTNLQDKKFNAVNIDDDGLDKHKSMVTLPTQGHLNSNKFNLLGDDRNKSESELRIYQSLNKLSLPDWYTSSQWHSQDLLPLPNTKSPGLTIPEPPHMDSIDPELPRGHSGRPVVIQHWITPSMRYSPSSSRQSSPMRQSIPEGGELPSNQLRQSQKSLSFSKIAIKDFEEIKTKLPPKKSPERPAKEAYLRLREQSKSREELDARKERSRSQPARIVYTDMETVPSSSASPPHVPIIKEPGSTNKQVLSPDRTSKVIEETKSDPAGTNVVKAQSQSTKSQDDPEIKATEPTSSKPVKKAKGDKKKSGKKTKKLSSKVEAGDGSTENDATAKKTKKKSSKSKKEKEAKKAKEDSNPKVVAIKPELVGVPREISQELYSPASELDQTGPDRSAITIVEGPIDTSTPQLGHSSNTAQQSNTSAVISAVGHTGQVGPTSRSNMHTGGGGPAHAYTDTHSDSARGSSLMESNSGSPASVTTPPYSTQAYGYETGPPQSGYTAPQVAKIAPQPQSTSYSQPEVNSVPTTGDYPKVTVKTVSRSSEYTPDNMGMVHHLDDNSVKGINNIGQPTIKGVSDVTPGVCYSPQGVKTSPRYSGIAPYILDTEPLPTTEYDQHSNQPSSTRTSTYPANTSQAVPRTSVGIRTVPHYANVGKITPSASPQSSGAQDMNQEPQVVKFQQPLQTTDPQHENAGVKLRKKKKHPSRVQQRLSHPESLDDPIAVQDQYSRRPLSTTMDYNTNIVAPSQAKDRPISYPTATQGTSAGPKYYTDTSRSSLPSQHTPQYYTAQHTHPQKHTPATQQQHQPQKPEPIYENLPQRRSEPVYVNFPPRRHQESEAMRPSSSYMEYSEEPRARGGGSGRYQNRTSKSDIGNVPSPGQHTSLEEVLDGLLAMPSSSSTSSLSPLLPNEPAMERACRLLRQAATPQGSTNTLNVTASAENLNATTKLTSSSSSSPIKYGSLPLQAHDAEGSGEITVKCSNTKCGACTDLSEARQYYKTCHNCYTYYCSRECRKAHWQRHKNKCLFSRVNSMCKHVIKKIHDDVELGTEMTHIARTGYLSQGRGCVMFVFSSPDEADQFIKHGWYALVTPPVYMSTREMEQSDLFGEQVFELTDMCKTYNPEIKYVLEVAIIAGWEVPSKSVNRKEGPAIKKCAKLRLVSDKPCVTPQPKQDPDTLILTAVPGAEYTENMEGKKAREICFVNIQRQLRQRGVSLRHDFPDVYSRLCKYVSDDEHFTPITLFPVDGKTRRRFMCLIMPHSEPDIDWMDKPDLLDELGLNTTV